MRIGKLNDWFSNIGFHVTFAGTGLIPELERKGNPLKGEPLFTNWKSIRDNDIQLHISLPQPCYVDTLVLQLGEKTSLQEVRVCQDGQILGRHCAETGKGTSDRTLCLQVDAVCSNFSVIISVNFSTLDILDLSLYGAQEDGIDLFPTPACVTAGSDFVSVHSFTGWCADTPQATDAASILCEKFQEKTGVSLNYTADGNVCLQTDPVASANSYRLEVSETGAVIWASDLRGFVCGVETLIKLIQDQQIPVVSISDAPAHAFRGVHLFIPSAESMEFARRLIKYVISPMGYNTIIMQVSGGMIYDRHPNISAAFANAVQMGNQGRWPIFPHSGIAEGKPITKVQLREYLDYINRFGIEVIPEIQSLGHVQYMTHAYPEIAEIPESEETQSVDTREEDMLPSQFYRHSYCPSNERSYEILFDIIDEIIEVFRPREYVHMGHDEVREIGVCSKCKHRDPAELFAQDVNRIHAYLAQRGLKMMLWADMLQPVSKYQTPPAIDRIPKDILLLDFIWYFHLPYDIEDNLLEKGFQVILGNLYSSHFPRYESRSRKQGILGGQISAWVATNEYEMQKEGKLYDILMTAQLLWADAYRKEYMQVYDNMLRANMPQLRDQLRGICAPSRTPGAVSRLLSETHIMFPPTLPVAPQEVSINGTYDSFIFSHTALRKITRLPWSPLDTVAVYTLYYQDGTTEEIPVTYGGNVGYWNRKQNQPLTHKLYRHTGYTATYYSDSITSRTADGQYVTFYRWEYIPKQRKPVSSIRLTQTEAFAANIFMQSLVGITAERSIPDAKNP